MVQKKDLVELYQNSTCLIYPSLYEGFGFPILEAMACGCPVITSNYGSMAEIAGDAAILVDPLSVEEISAAIKKVVKNKAFTRYIIKKGVEQTKNFSWKELASKILVQYKLLASSG